MKNERHGSSGYSWGGARGFPHQWSHWSEPCRIWAHYPCIMSWHTTRFHSCRSMAVKITMIKDLQALRKTRAPIARFALHRENSHWVWLYSRQSSNLLTIPIIISSSQWTFTAKTTSRKGNDLRPGLSCRQQKPYLVLNKSKYYTVSCWYVGKEDKLLYKVHQISNQSRFDSLNDFL